MSVTSDHYIELMNSSVGFAADRVAHAANEMARPSAIYKPRFFIDGNQWCAIYGENLQDGVAGFGNSPEQAAANFDYNWKETLPASRRTA